VRLRFSRRLGWDVLGLLLFVVLIFPVFWMVSTALKSNAQIYGFTPTWFPRHPTLSHFRDAVDRPYFWTDAKNSVIVVVATVVIALALSFFAAVALSKYRFSGRKLFIVLVIAIQMVPQAGLIIPLYKLLANHNQVDKLTGVIVVYLTFALPFCVWTLRGFLLGIPKDLEPRRRVRPHPAAARRARARRDVGLRVHHELERVHLREHAPPVRRQADDHRLALAALRREPLRRLGRDHGRLDADRDSSRDLLPARPAPDRLRLDRRSGESVNWS
jgi:hypothetical protein